MTSEIINCNKIEIRQSALCPTCEVPIKRENISIDHEFQKEIHNIPVFCNNRQAGCNWEGNFKEHFVSHLKKIKGFFILLNKDYIIILLLFLKTHQEECEFAEGDLLCEFCKILLDKQKEKEHYEICQKFLIPCPTGCGVKELPREKVQEHLDNVCAKNEIQCPFLQCGCAFKSKRGEMPKHLR